MPATTTRHHHTMMRLDIATGMALGVLAMLFFSRLTPQSTYASGVLPGLLVLGLAVGAIFAPSIGTATLGVDRGEAGVASALVNTSQQVGGSIGTALLSTTLATAARDYTSSHPHVAGRAAAATVHGYATAFIWAAGVRTAGLIVALVVIPATPRQRQHDRHYNPVCTKGAPS